MLTDTHCHLNLIFSPDELSEVITRAWAAGVERILVPGVDLETSQLAIWLAEKHARIYAAVGIHPGYASAWTDDTLSVLTNLAHHPKVTAIGEIGLDYYRDHAPRSLQRDVFESQLALAAQLQKPVSVHIRDSWEDTWSALASWHRRLVENGNPLADHPGVLHSFEGTLAQSLEAVAKNFKIGISGPVTFKNARARQELVAGLPLEKILIETDSPYLTPHPHRGKRNEPAHTRFIVEKIAGLHQISFETVAAVTAENASRLFAWSN